VATTGFVDPTGLYEDQHPGLWDGYVYGTDAVCDQYITTLHVLLGVYMRLLGCQR
jgi:hypothetical protein